MASERPEPRLIVHSVAAAAREGAGENAADLDELLNENRKLREVVIYLSEVVIRNALGRR